MKRKEFLIGSSALGLMAFMPDINAVEGLAPKMSGPNLDNSLWYIGHLMSVLVSGKDTGGAFALIHGYEIQGLEPPPHIHTKEDESFYVINGEINFTVDNEVLKAESGKWVFLPRNIRHSFKVVTGQAEVLIHLSPGGFEEYFREMSEPAKELSIPPAPEGPPDVKRIIETASRYGIVFPDMG